MVTDYEIFVSVLQPSALKMGVEAMAETFAPNKLGPRPYIPPSRSSHNIEAAAVKASDKIYYDYAKKVTLS